MPGPEISFALWGGDEFIILLPKTALENAEQLIRSIQDEFKKHEIRSIKGALSLGCSTKLIQDENIYSVMEIAENNMYTQKTLQHGNI